MPRFQALVGMLLHKNEKRTTKRKSMSSFLLSIFHWAISVLPVNVPNDYYIIYVISVFFFCFHFGGKGGGGCLASKKKAVDISYDILFLLLKIFDYTQVVSQNKREIMMEMYSYTGKLEIVCMVYSITPER